METMGKEYATPIDLAQLCPAPARDPSMSLVLPLDLPLGFALELDLDPDRGCIDSAGRSWRGLTFAEAQFGRA
jgi:hypothetical protein